MELYYYQYQIYKLKIYQIFILLNFSENKNQLSIIIEFNSVNYGLIYFPI